MRASRWRSRCDTQWGAVTQTSASEVATGGTSAARTVLSGYDSLMIEEGGEQLPQESAPESTTSDDMAEALQAMKASSPSLGSAIDAAGVTPETLAGAHERATPDEPDAAKPTLDEGAERG